MTQFRNPYHFVPAGGEPPQTVPLSEFAAPRRGEEPPPRRIPHLAHDRFVPGAHSGTVQCRVTVETPLICGNKQVGNGEGEPREGWTKLIKPYTLENGDPALPPSALRGMISAIAEAASGSALRILKDTPLSHRMATAGESLSAIGLLVEVTDAQGNHILRLQPLTAPTVDCRPDRRQPHWLPPDTLGAEYDGMFQPRFCQPLLKAYVNGYRRVDRSSVEVARDSFLQRLNPNSRSADHREFWYAKLRGSVSLSNRKLEASHGVRDSPKNERNPGNRFLLAQQIDGDPIPQQEYEKRSLADQEPYTRGFLRVLGIEGRESEIPTTKKHEYFIPYPDGSETAIPAFPVSGAVQRFHRLADQRTETDSALPFEVAGSSRNGRPGSRDRRLRLRAGDLVYFRPDSRDTNIVAEVSVSSIWRAGNGSVYEYFADISPDLLPLAPGREQLTLAEQLFGVVEIRDSGQEKKLKTKPAFALASRLRISHGLLYSAPGEGAWQPVDGLLSAEQREACHRHNLPDIPLQNLASPKPPSPSLYFKPKNGDGGYVSKQRLTPASATPQGRKFYLRRDPGTYRAADAAFVHPGRLVDQSERDSIARQHQSVERFIRRDSVFAFDIRFDNLSDLELALLIYSLSPAEAFRHQIGHGKPLGLGQIRIEVDALRLVKREKRYSNDGLLSDRWHETYDTENGEAASKLREKVDSLRRAFQDWAAGHGLGPALGALENIGAPVTGHIPIHYPQTNDVQPGAAEFQNEHFKWFSQNDDTSKPRRTGQFLAPLADAGGRVAASLPQLDRRQLDNPPSIVYLGPARQPLQPKDFIGKIVTAIARETERDGRVRFSIRAGETEFPDLKSYFDVSKYLRSAFAKNHPSGTETDAVLVNIQNGGICQLKKPKS